LAVGSLHVDLQDLTVPEGDTAEVTAHVSVGEVIVTVPPEARVQVEAAADAGAVRVLGLPDRAGIDRLPVRHTDGGSTAASPALVLHGSVDVGQVEVRRG
jgi:predicted membrane protein